MERALLTRQDGAEETEPQITPPRRRLATARRGNDSSTWSEPPFRRRYSRNLSPGSTAEPARKSEARAMIGTLRNVFLPCSTVAVQIPGRAPVDYFEPVVGGAEERRERRTRQQLGGPLRWREGAIRRGIRERPSSNGCTMHSQKSFAPLSCANSFSFFNRTFHISTNRKTGSAVAARRRRSKEKETQIRIVSFRPPPPSFNCPSSHHQPLAPLISRSPRRCHTRTRSQKPGSG